MLLGLVNLYMSRPEKQFDPEVGLFLATLSNILGLYLLNSFYALRLMAVPSMR